MNILTNKVAAYEKGILRATVIQVSGTSRFIIAFYQQGKKLTLTGLSDDLASALSTARHYVGV